MHVIDMSALLMTLRLRNLVQAYTPTFLNQTASKTPSCHQSRAIMFAFAVEINYKCISRYRLCSATAWCKARIKMPEDSSMEMCGQICMRYVHGCTHISFHWKYETRECECGVRDKKPLNIARCARGCC